MELLKSNKNDGTRGQVGIGTLIVFIAMVLVAAIAAGVLINTAGFLQTQAEDTGTDSTSQVADNLNIITETGDIGFNDDDDIEKLRLGVQPAAGSDDINLAELTLQYVSDDDFANIVVGVEDDDSEDADDLEQATGDTNPDDIKLSNDDVAEYGVNPITAEDPTDVVMTDNADRYEIVVPLEAGANLGEFESLSDDLGQDGADSSVASELSALDEGNEVEITVTTSVGAQTIAFLQVPDSLSAQETEDTVNL